MRRLVLALLLVACGGGRIDTTGPAPDPLPQPPSGPADIPAMRALLQRYSATGHYILTTHDALPGRFVLGDTTITLSHSGGFGDYFADGAPAELVGNMGTAVHEVYHAYSSLMGYQLLVDARLPRADGVHAIYVGGAPLLVRYGPLYPAAEMDTTFPGDARSFRYPTYVSPSQPTQSTQSEGVYGLLDEWAAYYHSSRTQLDFWPWVRDEAPADARLLWSYHVGVQDVWMPHVELKMFVLHYLLHAQRFRPDVYRALLADAGFRRAFVAVDAAYAALIAEGARLEPTIQAFARSRGVDLGRGVQRDAAELAALQRYLASPPYRALAAELAR